MVLVCYFNKCLSIIMLFRVFSSLFELRFCAKGLKEDSPFCHTRLLLLIEVKPSPDLKMKNTTF